MAMRAEDDWTRTESVASWFALGLEVFLCLWLLYILATGQLERNTKPVAPIIVPACPALNQQGV